MEKTTEQLAIAKDLATTLGIDVTNIYFLNPAKPVEPWLTAHALTTVARQSDELREVADEFVAHIPELSQIIYRGLVVDAQGRRFSRTGVATFGEKNIDTHTLAAGRAVAAALTAAGFNPLRRGSVVARFPERQPVDDAASRNNDLKRIHALASRAGLIHGRDFVGYRNLLREYFGTDTAADFDGVKRGSLINLLEMYVVDAPSEFGEIPKAA